jgi:hypothetical protein
LKEGRNNPDFILRFPAEIRLRDKACQDAARAIGGTPKLEILSKGGSDEKQGRVLWRSSDTKGKNRGNKDQSPHRHNVSLGHTAA